MTAVDASLTHDTPIAPATLQQWRPYIPEHVDPTASPAPGGHCECPTVAHIVLHVEGCAQGVAGRAQPYGPDTCAEYALVLNSLIDAAELGAALRGITVQGLALAMELEAEDRALDVHAAKSAYEAGVAEGESEAEALFETLRKRLPVEQYDAVLDGLDMNDPDAVLTRLRAEVAALPAPFTVPPAPGAGQALAAAPDVADSSAAPEVEDDAEQDDAEQGEVELDMTVREFTGTAPKPGQIFEYPVPSVPAHVPPVQGARTEWRDVQPPLANAVTHAFVEHEWIFSATPGLSQIAAAADARGTARWGLLGTLLPRVAASIPPCVRLVPPAGAVQSVLDEDETGDSEKLEFSEAEGTSINLYSVAVSGPSTGKTDAMTIASGLIPNAVAGLRTVAPGTGEGVLKEFPRVRPDDGADGEGDDKNAAEGAAPEIDDLGDTCSILMESDEIDVFVGEMMRQGSRTSGWYRSMWMGGEVGNTVSDKDRRSAIAAHTYRFGIVLGAQPDAVAPMFAETGRGTPQRFMWLPAQQSLPRGAYPAKLEIAPVYWFNGSPSMIPTSAAQAPVWVYPPKAAKDQLARDRWRAATADPFAAPRAADKAAAIADRHAVLQQLKVAVLLAALDGLAQPQDTHWFAAGAVMQVRRATIHRLVAESERVKAEGKEAEGALNGVYRASSDAARDAERDRHVSRCATRIMAGLVKAAVSGQPPMTHGAAIRLLSGKKGASGRSDRDLYGRAALAVVRASPGVVDTGTHVHWAGTAAAAV
ncbi:bifunctional DNA primase/polymerase domain protein [Mycobacteroides abscessus subsp. abscessus]|nr:bifunctional DNA primase/polymerase domain protein [Mycobacteroides abscessus subsp. abscessus]SIM97352.1 bifunctional DNA primase/polymerase domain protein [Mycobacteroides abscessus subsp. abscessus]SIN10117.1 bifunctional DNA primase/polymerase domain protein [Mycobacteroides abscessus subsp. abscessus]SIN15631.1 bifunctional DNA primase/polymerase domain protein [Mycobacteroides abscessus subsp. abscessus]SLJ02323.1 bifunctional DNA primase/polymerase domain protein [Mycobacteroides absc